jgi:hypothetical protein
MAISEHYIIKQRWVWCGGDTTDPFSGVMIIDKLLIGKDLGGGVVA